MCLMAQTARIARWPGNAAAALTYTFDDGLLEDYTVVFPALRERNLVGTFCVIGSKVGRDQKGTPCCSWDQLKEMSESGMEIASHGYSHQNVEKLDSVGIEAEVSMNDSVIEQHLGHRPETYCFPGNRKTELARRIIERNHVGCRLFQTSLGSKRDSLWMTNWLHEAMARGEWIVGMTHGIRIGYDHFPTEEAVQAWYHHLDEVAALQRAGQLWVATLSDVLKYQQEREASTVTVTSLGDSLSVHLACPLDSSVYSVPLTILITLPDGTEIIKQI